MQDVSMEKLKTVKPDEKMNLRKNTGTLQQSLDKYKPGIAQEFIEKAAKIKGLRAYTGQERKTQANSNKGQDSIVGKDMKEYLEQKSKEQIGTANQTRKRASVQEKTIQEKRRDQK